jgi:SAM-dependent methyltransferase
MKHIEADEIYRNLPLKDIPWNIETPPDVLVRLVESGKIKPCRAIDLGCGAGNYAIWLAGQGFDVTGVDISPAAIKLAKENARQKKVKCRFLVDDVLGDLSRVMNKKTGFAYDWELLHHIFPDKRPVFVRNVHRLLQPGGYYLSVCFHEKDPCFGGTGKFRRTPLGTELYFSSEEELESLFSPYFRILELKSIEISGKPLPHRVNYAFMEKSPIL